MAEIFQQLPVILGLALFIIFVYWFLAVYLARTRPPTQEPVVGNYTIHLKGTGLVLQGLMTTARSAISDVFLHQVARQGDKAKEFVKLIRECHLYGLRDGGDKVLVVSDRSLESQQYADSEQGSRWVFPHGTISFRNVYARGEYLDQERLPTVFNFFEPDWDAVVVLYPEDLFTGKHNFELAQKMNELGEGILLVKQAALASQESDSKDEIINLQSVRLEEAYERTAEFSDKANLLEQRSSLISPFGGEVDVEYDGGEGFLPSMSKARLLFIGVGAVAGYLKLPEMMTVTEQGGGILGAAACYFALLVWKNWLSD